MSADAQWFMETWANLNARQRRVMLHLGRLYLERHAAPGARVDAEIERFALAMHDDETLDVPRTQ